MTLFKVINEEWGEDSDGYGDWGERCAFIVEGDHELIKSRVDRANEYLVADATRLLNQELEREQKALVTQRDLLAKLEELSYDPGIKTVIYDSIRNKKNVVDNLEYKVNYLKEKIKHIEEYPTILFKGYITLINQRYTFEECQIYTINDIFLPGETK